MSFLKTAVPLFHRNGLKVGLQKIISLEKERFPDCSHPAALTPQPSTFPVDLSRIDRISKGLLPQTSSNNEKGDQEIIQPPSIRILNS